MRSRSQNKAAALSLSLVLLGSLAHAGIVKAHDLGAPGQREADDQVQQVEQVEAEAAPDATPAQQFIADLLNDPAQGWEELTPWQVGTTAAWWPTGTGTADHQPVLSASGTWRTDAGDVVLDVVVYPPGLGAAALAERIEGTGATTAGSLGQEDYQVTGTWSGSAFGTRTWRHGDVVLALSHAGSGDGGLSEQVDARVRPLLDGRCTGDGSAHAQAVRSPLHPDYTGLLTTHEVTIDAPELDQDTRRALAEDLAHPATVHLPARPSYPVWPELPAPVPAPTMPAHPGEVVTSGTYTEQVEDRTGPGCGWDFTGAAAPAFDQQAARQQAQAAEEEMLDQLHRDAEQWATEARDYASAVDDYNDQLARHATYAQQVDRVRQAWDDIGAQWAAYEEDLDEYEQAVQAREEFEAEQEQAEAEHQRLVERCQELREEREEDQDHPEQEHHSSPQPCEDLTAPDILSSDPPPVPAEPVPPADPRPSGGDE